MALQMPAVRGAVGPTLPFDMAFVTVTDSGVQVYITGTRTFTENTLTPLTTPPFLRAERTAYKSWLINTLS